MTQEVAPKTYQLAWSLGSDYYATCYYVVRAHGNYLFYQLPYKAIEQQYDGMLKKMFYGMGGVAKQLLNESDQLIDDSATVFSHYGAPVTFGSGIEPNESIAVKTEVLNRDWADPDLKVVSFETEDDCPSWFVLKQKQERILFSGSTLFLDDGKWNIHPSLRGQPGALTALLQLKEIEFSMWLPRLFHKGAGYRYISEAERRGQIDGLLHRYF